MSEKIEKSNSNPLYVSEDLAIIVPTKDRPKELERLLWSIYSLDCKIGRVIVVASGLDVKEVVMKFNPSLPVEYYNSGPGQIRQRNQGISLLSSSTKLVATMDDDTVFKKSAITEIIKFWNQVEPETAGVGFNIVNLPPHKHTWIRGVFGISTNEPGRVLKSGINTGISNIKQTIRTEWLNGGGTVWRQDILQKYEHQEIISKWSIGEDLIFSYSVGKQLPLYVCASACIEAEEIEILNLSNNSHIYRGKTQFLWGLYFILSNKNLSLFHYILYKFIESCSKFIKAILFSDFYKLYNAIGIIDGILLSIKLLVINDLLTDRIKHIIEDNG